MPETSATINWDELARLGKLRAVIDPHDVSGFKNILIDRVHWAAIKPELRQSKTVLDFGCGTGRLAKRINELGLNYVGIDSSAEMIKAARDWYPQGTFQVFNGMKTEFGDGTFDTVVVARVFIHFLKAPEFQTMLEDIHRILKPGGHLILLEEASRSGKKSGQARWSLTQEDFISALSPYFAIEKIRNVRSSEFSKLSRRLTEWCDLPYPIFRLILAPLTWFESRRVAQAGEDYFRQVTYYDFLIHARKAS